MKVSPVSELQCTAVQCWLCCTELVSFTSFDKSFRISLRPAGTEIVLVFCFVPREEEGEVEVEDDDCRLVSLDLLLIFRPRFSSDLVAVPCLPCLPGTLRLSLFSL